MKYNPGRRASGQDHAQLHVGQVWPTIKQDPSQRIRWPGDNRKPSSQQHEKSQDYGPPGNKTAPCQGTDGVNFHSWSGPLMAGIFERVVNLMTVLSYEEWMTVVVEVEMILSCRPLSYVSFKDPEEPHRTPKVANELSFPTLILMTFRITTLTSSHRN